GGEGLGVRGLVRASPPHPCPSPTKGRGGYNLPPGLDKLGSLSSSTKKALMGRILEMLKHADGRREQRDHAAPELRVVSGSEVEEEVPFIEVGGPRSTLVASPSVLASPVPAVRETPPVVEVSPAPSVSLPAVTFQPLPAEP